MNGTCRRCQRPKALLSRWLCNACYKAATKAGERDLYPKYDPLGEWLETVTGTSGCWIWPGYCNEDGYGQVSIGGRVQGVHIAVWERLVGPVPPGLELDHRCRVRSCANPADLEPVTHQVNVLRGEASAAANARATYCVHNHALVGANLEVRSDGKRGCRACHQASSAVSRAARRGEIIDLRGEADRRFALLCVPRPDVLTVPRSAVS